MCGGIVLLYRKDYRSQAAMVIMAEERSVVVVAAAAGLAEILQILISTSFLNRTACVV
jgi:hypothetical protein